MTEKLYDQDSQRDCFHAVVLSCEASGDGFLCVLDRTAFFPEGGGQSFDTGYIANVAVTDVQERDGVIRHTIGTALPVGMTCFCRIDRKKRFRRMQNHTGEHIFSGMAHRLFGADNVGFHMTDTCMTVDFNILLSPEQLAACERLCNEVIYRNEAVTAYYPTARELETLDYRAKLELTENVRLVRIENCDLCACCAPHVKSTGAVGLLKVLDSMSHRGGVRVTLLCGQDAYEDYCRRFRCNRRVSALLSAKPLETPEAVERLLAETAALKKQYGVLRDRYNALLTDTLAQTDGSLCVFTTDCDAEALRGICNRGLPKCKKCIGAFSGDDTSGYSYVIASASLDLRALAKELNTALHGKGGGRREMIQGSLHAAKTDIEAFFSRL